MSNPLLNENLVSVLRKEKLEAYIDKIPVFLQKYIPIITNLWSNIKSSEDILNNYKNQIGEDVIYQELNQYLRSGRLNLKNESTIFHELIYLEVELLLTNYVKTNFKQTDILQLNNMTQQVNRIPKNVMELIFNYTKSWDNPLLYKEWTIEGKDIIRDIQILGDNIVFAKGDIYIMNLETGVVRTFHHNSVPGVNVYTIKLLGDLIIAGYDDGAILIWNINTGQIEKILQNQAESVTGFAVKDDIVVSSENSDFIKIWNYKTGNFIKSIDIESFPSYMGFKNDGHLLILDSDNNLTEWNIDTEVMSTIHDNLNVSMFMSNDTVVIASNTRYEIEIFDANDIRTLKLLEPAHYLDVVSMNIYGDLLVTGSWDSFIYIWNIRTGEHLSTLKMFNLVSSVAISDKYIVGSSEPIESGRTAAVGRSASPQKTQSYIKVWVKN